jgi:hypothetical protein
VQLAANASDPDGGGLAYQWSILQKPASSPTGLSNASSATASLTFSGEKDIGHWKVQVAVDDNEGERRTFPYAFDVPNAPPTATITGATSVNASQPLALSGTGSKDPDGGSLKSYSWDLLVAPPGASHAAQSGFATTPTLSLPTTGKDVGVWKLRLTVTDNENATAKAEVSVEVKNLPPKIQFTGATDINVGQTLAVGTSLLTDEDGGNLTFSWDILQAPSAAPLGVQTGYSSASSLSLPTGPSFAGTWTFRLTAKDDENATVSKNVSVLVDAPPEAAISGPVSLAHTDGLLELDGGDSVDPDSPCPGDPQHCHETLSGPATVSPGITQSTWFVTDLPSSAWSEFTTGRVDDVFGVNASAPTLVLDWVDLRPGAWRFRLEVKDAEGNLDAVEHTVQVLPLHAPPVAVVSGPQRYTTDTLGFTPVNIGVSGGGSYDVDNVLGQGGSLPGLAQYTWQAMPPPGCVAPALPNGPVALLYPAGSSVPPQCQGLWTLQLTVTDDDSPAQTDTEMATFAIGNCAGVVCIDAPTTASPYVVQSVEATDVFVFYHLDSALYDEPAFQFGMFTQLDVLPAGGATPVFTAYEANVSPASKGGLLAFNWNGYDNHGLRAPNGKYDVRITLLDWSFNPTGFATLEPSALHLAAVEGQVLPFSDRYVEAGPFNAGTAQASFSYQVTGAQQVDTVKWRVRNASKAVVYTGTAPAALGGTIAWSPAQYGFSLGTGAYTFEVEAFQGGKSVALTAPWAFTVWRMQLKPPVSVPAGDPVPLFANNDDDNGNGVPDATEGFASEDDLVAVDVKVEPASLQGTLVLQTDGAGNPVKFWTSLAKAAQGATYVLGSVAVPPQVFLEGVDPAATTLRLKVLTPEGPTLEATPLELDVIRLSVVSDSNGNNAVDPTDAMATRVPIARWDNAYDAAFNVLNGGGTANFIEQDPRRFYLRVEHPAYNQDPTLAEVSTLQVGTVTAAGTPNDDPTPLVLLETGPDTGVFVSRGQLLTANDSPLDPDDDFAAYDDLAGIIPDDLSADRTHRADPAGRLLLGYQPPGAAASKAWGLTVCGDQLRKVQVRMHVFLEPFKDEGYDHDGDSSTPPVEAGNGVFSFADLDSDGQHDPGEPSEPFLDIGEKHTNTWVHGGTPGLADGWGPVVPEAKVQQELERANLSWAQACVFVEQLGPTLVESAPKVGGVDILADGSTSFPEVLDFSDDDLTVIYKAYEATLTPDVVDVFFAADQPAAWGVAAIPTWSPGQFDHGDKVFTVINPQAPVTARVLAHELGHLTTNHYDEPNTQNILFPAETTTHDTTVSSRRRMTGQTEQAARTWRPLGDLDATGNSFLKQP